MDVAHGPDSPCLNKLHHPPVIVPGVDLSSHLGDEFVLAGDCCHQSGFVDAVGQRFLAVAMLAEFHRHHPGRGVDMIRGTDHDRVDLVVHLIEHRAEILIPLGRGEFLKGACCSALINITQGDDVLACYTVHVGRAATANADAGNVQLLISLRRVRRPAV